MKNKKTQNKQLFKLVIIFILAFPLAGFLSCEANKKTSEEQNETKNELGEGEMIIEQGIDESESGISLLGTWEVEYSKFINDDEMGEEMKPLAPTFWVFESEGKMNIENTSVIKATYELEDSVLQIDMGMSPLVYKILVFDNKNMEVRTIKKEDYDTETYVKLERVE